MDAVQDGELTSIEKIMAPRGGIVAGYGWPIEHHAGGGGDNIGLA